MAVRRRTFEVFSLSFLDCICCGFGAMLLLFVLTVGRASSQQRSAVAQVQTLISTTAEDVAREQERERTIEADLARKLSELARQRVEQTQKKSAVTELREKLALLLKLKAQSEEEHRRLLAERESIPTVEERPPVPIPNVQRRQYLSGFNFDGRHLLLLVEMSGGMLGNSVDEALALQFVPDSEKRKAVKWRRVVKSVQWIIANLGPEQRYQILTYNAEARPLLAERSDDEWLDPMDRETTRLVLRRLDEIVPSGGANLERAFAEIRRTFPSTDIITLLTHRLPTLSDSAPSGPMTTDEDRIRNFRAALKNLPRQTPVNVILYPMSGDPAGPFLFWQLVDRTDGSLISPAPSWPDIDS